MPYKKFTNKSIFNHFRIALIGFAALATVAIVLVLISYQFVSYKKSVEQVKEEHIFAARQFAKNIVNIESDYMTRIKESFDERKVAELEANVQEAYNLATTIYQENHNKLTPYQIKRLIIKSVASLGSASTRQYVAINTTDGRGVYNPNNPSFDGKNLLLEKDRTGSYFVQEELKIVKERGEGFRYETDTLTNKTKVVFVKEFPAYDWYFLALLYPSDYYSELIEEASNTIGTKFFGYRGDIFIYDAKGNIVADRGRVLAKEERFNLITSNDSAAQNLYKVITASSKNHPEGGFIHYPWYYHGSKEIGVQKDLSDKISYVKFYPALGWFIGAGFFVSEVDVEIDEQISNLHADFIEDILQVVLLFALIVALQMFFLRRFEGQFADDFNSFIYFFKKSAEKLSYLQPEKMNSKEFKELGDVANEMVKARLQVEKKLLNEQEKAREADRLKSSFLANISHEIRTPMNAIIGFSNFLAEDLSPEERKEFVALIKTSGDSLLNLIDSIIDFSKIEVEQVILNDNYVAYDKLCSDLDEKYNHLIQEEKLNVKFKLVNTLPAYFMSLTDKYRLKQVLEHILSNAFKFTSSGEIVLNVYHRDDKIYFKVSDTGIGISPENQKRIFERFTQVEGKLSRNYGGMGIGLSISAKLVEMLGGEIEVKSELGKGTTFQFYIPLIIE
ncbi:MAG: cache domain-containing protein [Mangrovibacterium sp.]